MRPRTLLVLLAVVLGLGAFIWFYERDLPSSEERAALEKKLLDVEKDQVTGLVLAAEGREVRLARVDVPREQPAKEEEAEEAEEEDAEAEGLTPAEPEPEWRIEGPDAFSGARADAGAIDRFLDALLSAEKSRTLEDVDEKAVGLETPRATVRLVIRGGDGDGGEEKVIEVGADVPTGGGTIVALAGSPEAYVVRGLPLTDVTREPGSWRDSRLVHGDREAIERITLSQPAAGSPPVVLARRGEGFWVESPVKDRADRDAVDRLLGDLSTMQADRFLDEPPGTPAELGLEPPRAVVQVVTKGAAEPLAIALGSPVPAVAADADPVPIFYARVGGQVVETRTGLAEALARGPAAWRSPALSGLEVYQVESLRLKDSAGEIAVERSGTDWKRGKDLISYTPVSDLLYALTSARAERLLAPEEARELGAAFGTPALAVTLEAGAGGKETLSLYRPVAAGAPARVEGREVVLLLPAGKLEEVQGLIAAVRTAEPLPATEQQDADQEEE